MKKTQKKILGLFGLGAVVAITAVAVALPSSPGALAVSTVTDTLTLTVKSSEVEATITEPLGNPVFVTQNQRVAFDYAGADTVTAILEYTNVNGNVYTYTIADIVAGQEAGTFAETLNLANYGIEYADYDYGYGDYKLIVTSTSGSIVDEDYAVFSYYPVIGTAAQESDTNTVVVDLDYDRSDSSIIKNVVLNIYDGEKIVKSITVEYPTNIAKIDFSGLEDGKYTITATAYGENGLLYKAYLMSVEYIDHRSVIPVPNTGGIFKNSNISQTDYLITGLIIFGIVAVAGVVFVMRNDKKTSRSKKTNRRK